MEKSIKGTKTEQNLLKSFAGESQARSRYTFFASVAKKEGYEQIAGVFMERQNRKRSMQKNSSNILKGVWSRLLHLIRPVLFLLRLKI